MSAMACPSEDELLAFAEGRLDQGAVRGVERHLAACSDCAALFPEAVRGLDDSQGPTRDLPTLPLAKRAPLEKGTVLGRFVVLQEVGAGGIGRVYAAYDPELDRKIALKVLRAQSERKGLSSVGQRMQREAQAMAKLSHRNVVPIYDVGWHDGQLFIAMELIEGTTLRGWSGAASRSWREIRDVLLAAGDGLAAAHAAGIVHRDFKPGNVLVGNDGRVLVTDFGLARGTFGPTPNPDAGIALDEPLLEADLTETGVVMGTPGYMAPEQVRRAQVDPRADQFAFCVTAYEALLGQRPFHGRTMAELVTNVEAGRPRPPAADRAVPAWLRAAISTGLAADPADRHPSMAALLHAMVRDRRSRRRQWALAGALVAVSASVSGFAVWSARQQPAALIRSEVEQFEIDARAAAAKGYFVFPPADEPDGVTGFNVILALQTTQDDAALQAAERLRQEFADTLIRLGDSFWDRPGGILFATEYYGQALVFDPSRVVARERTPLATGIASAWAQKAAQAAGFTKAERARGELLASLARDDPPEKIRALRRKHPPPPSIGRQLDELIGTEPATKAEPLAPRVASSKAEPPAPEKEATKPDKRKAKELIAAGERARGAGKLEAAHDLFQKALGAGGRKAQALRGLSRVAHDQNRPQQMLHWARQAADAAPRSGLHRFQLGLALEKNLNYPAAEQAYQLALDLGHKPAARALARVERRLPE